MKSLYVDYLSHLQARMVLAPYLERCKSRRRATTAIKKLLEIEIAGRIRITPEMIEQDRWCLTAEGDQSELRSFAHLVCAITDEKKSVYDEQDVHHTALDATRL